MDTGLYSGVAAMRVSERRLDAITTNLANVSTPAYKRLGSVTQSFDVGLGLNRHREVATRHATDFSQGEIERTGNTLDLALEGQGFFATESANGEVFTRNGKLHVDEQGVLQTADGYPLAWEGARGAIQSVGEPVTVDGSGEVRQGALQIGRLKIVDFADAQRLELDGQGYFHAPRDLAHTSASAIVHQGAIERSNASSVDELVALIRVQRNFESAASVMRSIDQSYKRLDAAR